MTAAEALSRLLLREAAPKALARGARRDAAPALVRTRRAPPEREETLRGVTEDSRGGGAGTAPDEGGSLLARIAVTSPRRCCFPGCWSPGLAVSAAAKGLWRRLPWMGLEEGSGDGTLSSWRAHRSSSSCCSSGSAVLALRSPGVGACPAWLMDTARLMGAPEEGVTPADAKEAHEASGPGCSCLSSPNSSFEKLEKKTAVAVNGVTEFACAGSAEHEGCAARLGSLVTMLMPEAAMNASASFDAAD